MIKIYTLIAVLILLLSLTVVKKYIFPTPQEAWLTEIPIAHRGFFDNSQNIPENSLMAFKRAIKRGYSIELDVMLTKDGQVIVHHDHDLKRLSGADKRVENLTLAELQSHTLLQTDESPPTLQQVLEVVAGQVPLYIEIKHEQHTAAGPLEEKVADLLDHYKGRVAILSYNPQSLEWFSQHAPQYYRGQNFDPHDVKERTVMGLIASCLTEAWKTRGHFLVYDHSTMPQGFVSFFSVLRPLISYHVTSQEEYEAAKRYASNIIFERLTL